MSTNDPRSVAETYFRAWRNKDYSLYRSILADDVVFDGPMGHEEGADACAKAFEGLGNITTDVVIDKMFVDGPDVTTWFQLHTKPASLSPVVNWSHVENGKISRIRVAFDPRPLLEAG
jgi:hypothetical protein